MALCEAAGFDVILIETVGVGQAEVLNRILQQLIACAVGGEPAEPPVGWPVERYR